MKTYYWIGLFILLAGIFAYHFIAENNAEDQIHEAIQEQNNNPHTRLSIQYSSIDISTFKGNISFSDVTVVQDTTIHRSKNILVDLGYWDFLKIYIGGLEFGLKHLTNANLALIQPTQVNRNSLAEIKFDTLNLEYSGNAWDGIERVISDSTFKIDHDLYVQGKGLRFAKPNSHLGLLKAQSFELEISITEGTSLLLPGGSGNAQFKRLSWTPPPDFQQNYSFFIKGFGFQPDSIPIQQAHFLWAMEPSLPGIDLKEGKINTELCQINLKGNIITAPSLENARLDSAEISVSNFSDQFARVIENMEKLLDTSFPKQGNNLVFHIGGSLEKPTILNN